MSGQDIVIIGAGMAGASLAAMAAPFARVTVIEGEDQPGYHATGRSAAFWEETYGGPGILPLTVASGPYLREHGFLSVRGALNIGRESDRSRVEAFVSEFTALGAKLELLDHAEMARLVPGLRGEWTCGSWGDSCADIDVGAVHAHFLGLARREGVEVKVRTRLARAERIGSRWRLTMTDGSQIECDVLVNAAGAWADEVAQIAGARPLGITPLRRTVVQLRTAPPAPAALPLVLDINEQFYFKPESGRIWLSPHDETPSPACDAAPEELDVAIAIDRMGQVVDWTVDGVERKWAGLRSFAPDRLPVYGFDPVVEGFFWCAGQGGFGIQTSPAGASLAASLLLGREFALSAALDPGAYSPSRFG